MFCFSAHSLDWCYQLMYAYSVTIGCVYFAQTVAAGTAQLHVGQGTYLLRVLSCRLCVDSSTHTHTHTHTRTYIHTHTHIKSYIHTVRMCALCWVVKPCSTPSTLMVEMKSRPASCSLPRYRNCQQACTRVCQRMCALWCACVLGCV